MATATFTAAMSGGTVNLNKNLNRWTNALTKSATITGTVSSVVGNFYFSTNKSSVTYSVTATLYTSNSTSSTAVAQVTQNVKLTTASGTAVNFTFPALTPAQLNSVNYIHFTSSTATSSDTQLIYCKGDQTLTITYNPTTAVSAPTSVSLSSSTAAPGAGVTLSWSGAKAGTNNAISGYHIYRRNTLVTTSYTYLTAVTTTATSGSCTVTAPTVKGGKYTYAVYTLGAAGINSGASSTQPTLTANISFTDSTLTMESTPIKAVHMTELQNQVKALLSYYGKSASTFTTITAGTTKLSGWSSHVNELRTAYDKLGFTHATWISIPTNCPNVAVMNQLRKITTTLPDISSGGSGNTGSTTTTTTGTKTPASTTLKPQSKVTWKTSDTTSENASYAFSSATTGQVSTTLDLTSIPSNATISSATLTWSNSKSSTPSPYKLGSASHGVYVNGTDDAHKIGAITANTGNCKSLLVPGQVNTIYAKFYQAGASFTTSTSGSSLSHTVTYTVSNLKLTITYTA